MVSADRREDGKEYSTPVVEFVACTWCNTATPVRAAGRRPKYCSVECRKRHRAARVRVEKAYAELLDAEEALARKGSTPS